MTVEAFWLTALATALGAFPGVGLALLVEGWLRRRKDKERSQAVLQRMIAPGGELYGLRDWAHDLREAVEHQRPLGLSNHIGSHEALHSLASTPGLRPDLVSELMTLGAKVRRLSVIAENNIGGAVPEHMKAFMIAECREVSGIANDYARKPPSELGMR